MFYTHFNVTQDAMGTRLNPIYSVNYLIMEEGLRLTANLEHFTAEITKKIRCPAFGGKLLLRKSLNSHHYNTRLSLNTNTTLAWTLPLKNRCINHLFPSFIIKNSKQKFFAYFIFVDTSTLSKSVIVARRIRRTFIGNFSILF